ncbi:hypothetical protein COT63_00365 [Candidatus Shapirobacteria bacterium CG09_land_8_20_14_0_10_38_17]|uniref:Uncharacterized protein n=1 Tax=Candidatus Shapirobacteria bacterium CG09_land_8_20_14_0_10_38_17 TaxID=1974884 RepID=A0A2H0WRU5_9BACT|nr:MAG: hypothetical protein COT63_00365 [Candidatus Shapirobacteria bacterium CG09_land_8_20_14_0_10_38_17]
MKIPLPFSGQIRVRHNDLKQWRKERIFLMIIFRWGYLCLPCSHQPHQAGRKSVTIFFNSLSCPARIRT